MMYFKLSHADYVIYEAWDVKIQHHLYFTWSIDAKFHLQIDMNDEKDTYFHCGLKINNQEDVECKSACKFYNILKLVYLPIQSIHLFFLQIYVQ